MTQYDWKMLSKRTILIQLIAFVSLSTSAPMDGEGVRILKDQNAPNAIPRMGKRLYNMRSGIMLPSFTSGIIPSFPQFLLPHSKSANSKRRLNFSTRYSHAFPKRSAVADDWSSVWGNVLRSPQGFRLYDGGNSYLSNAVMYKKRGQDFTSELNSVPLMGKRDAEQELDTNNGQTRSSSSSFSLPDFQLPSDLTDQSFWASAVDSDPDFFDLFPEDSHNDIMADASLYPPVLGPHYRTILTRVQRSNAEADEAGQERQR